MTDKSYRALQMIRKSPGRHWVGDGFPVRSLFDYRTKPEWFSPFLLLDYAGPMAFEPTETRRGVGEHPHRGFETVTIVYQGQVEHRDSSGGGGIIGPGDVQWMTAASGLVHEEFHGSDFAADGGNFEMVQLWVNLPAKDKSAPPNYQGIKSEQIPVVDLPDNQGTLRVIAGDYSGNPGPAKTFTPIQIWDLNLNPDNRLSFKIPDGHTAALVVMEGQLLHPDGEKINEAEVGLFERNGTNLQLEIAQPTRALLLAGEPIDEPIVAQGPFVMNHPGEIRQAMIDYQSGKMGRLHG